MHRVLRKLPMGLGFQMVPHFQGLGFVQSHHWNCHFGCLPIKVAWDLAIPNSWTAILYASVFGGQYLASSTTNVAPILHGS